MANDKKHIMDVTKPGKVAASPTSRPIIVGHGSMMKDPVIKGEAPASELAEADLPTKPSAPAVNKGELRIEPIADAPVASSTSPEKSPEKLASAPSQPKPSSSEASGSTEKPAAVSPDPVADEAVIGAVASQAKIDKKQKDADDKEAEKQAALQKLIEDKTYFVPIGHEKRKAASRSLLYGLVGLLVVLAGAYAAIDAGLVKVGSVTMPFHVFKQKAVPVAPAPVAAIPVATKTPAATTPTPTATLATFSNSDLGISFSYPKEWGEVSVKKTAGKKGTAVSLAFSKQPLLGGYMLSKDYEDFGKDGSCLAMGLFPSVSLEALKSTIKEGTATDADSSYKTITKILATTATTLVYEQFESGSNNAIGVCPGLSVEGYASFPVGSAYTGVEFFWGGGSDARKAVTAAEFAKYVASPNDYLPQTTRDSLKSLVSSVKHL